MKRSVAVSTDDRVGVDAEEMKEFLPNSPVQKNKDGSQKRTSNRTSNLSGSVMSRDSASSVLLPTKVEDAGIKTICDNVLTRRMTIAGGFLDIALFTANCEQLKFVLELGDLHIYHNAVLALIIASLVLQLLVGFTMFLLVWQVFQKLKGDACTSFLNHATMGLVALITIINIFIGTFGPKGTVMARCLGAFAYPNTSGPIWKNYLNLTRNYIETGSL